MATTKKAAAKPVKAAGQTNGGGWFQSGYEAVGQEVQRQDQRQKEYENLVRRYWMPVGGDKNMICFVDGVPFNYREHNFYANNSWRHWATCLIGTGQKCPYDEAGNKNYFVGAYTVIDMNEWEARDGTKHRNDISLYAAKGDALKILKTLAERRGGDLAGCVFHVSRTGDKSPATGNVLDFVEKLPVKKFKVPLGNQMIERVILDSNDPKVQKKFGFKKPVLPINYVEKLAPRSRADAESYLTGLNISTAEEGDSSSEVAY